MKYISCCMLLLLCVLVSAEERLSQAQANLLKNAKQSLEQEQPAQVLEILERWKGKAHPTQLLIQGHALYQLQRWKEAAVAYQSSLTLDPDLKQAALALIDCRQRLEDWPALKTLLLKWAPAQSCSLQLLKVSIYCARSLGDKRWQAVLLQTGILRFANDDELRLMDIEMLIEQQDWPQAQVAIGMALKHVENPARFWQLLAYVYQQNAETVQALAAYEAAMLLEPANKRLRLEHAQAQLVAGHIGEALKQFKLIMQQAQSQNVVEMAIQSAYAAGDIQQAATWLEKIPIESRDQRLRALSLRFDHSLLDKKTFEKKVDDLLAKKAISAQLCLWLGSLAEQDQAFGRAELFYQLAREKNLQKHDDATQLASLYLARLWYRQKRSSEAVEILEQHLKSYPDDWQARRLLGMIQD